MRVLLIQDDIAVTRSVERCLQSNGFTFTTADSWDEGKSLALHYDHDLIVMDSVISDQSGYVLMTCLRSRNITTPFIVLSSFGSAPEETLKSFSHGADDYMRIPFVSDELAARMLAVIRRSMGFAHPVIEVGGLSVNLKTREVRVGTRRVKLTASEYKVLSCLCLRIGQSVAKSTLQDYLYVMSRSDTDERTVDAFVYRIRCKLEALGLSKIIQTVHGYGYLLEPVREST